MNYLGLGGLLGLTGDPDGPPVQSAGQIADIGGGAMTALVGLLVALRERERSGQGQFVDCSMFDGALSWLSLVAADMFATGNTPERGRLHLAGGIVCYRPYPCADGYVTLGALEPKFWANFCRGVGREDLLERAFDPPGSDTHQALEGIFRERTREQWGAFASECDCCLEPVLGLDEVVVSEQVTSREMVVELEQPGATRPVKLLGAPIKLSRTPADPTRAPGPALGQDTDELLTQAGYSEEEIAALHESGAVAGPAGARAGSFLSG